MSIVTMGAASVDANVRYVRFVDGSIQESAALAPPSGGAVGNPLLTDGSTPPNLSWGDVFIGSLQGFTGFVTGTISGIYAAAVVSTSGAQLTVQGTDGSSCSVQDFTTSTAGFYVNPPSHSNSTNMIAGEVTLGQPSGNTTLVGQATGNTTLIFPASAGLAGQFLQSDGGNPDQTLSWEGAAGTSTPATVGSPGTSGLIAYDDDYIYVCWATNSWKRAALSTW